MRNDIATVKLNSTMEANKLKTVNCRRCIRIKYKEKFFYCRNFSWNCLGLVFLFKFFLINFLWKNGFNKIFIDEFFWYKNFLEKNKLTHFFPRKFIRRKNFSLKNKRRPKIIPKNATNKIKQKQIHQKMSLKNLKKNISLKILSQNYFTII